MGCGEAMKDQLPPSVCPNCQSDKVKLVSSFPGSLTNPMSSDGRVNVYRRECGYLFGAQNVKKPPHEK